MIKVSVTQRFDGKYYVYTSDEIESTISRYRGSTLVMVKLVRLGFELGRNGVRIWNIK